MAEYDVHNGIPSDYFNINTRNLLERWSSLYEWGMARSRAGLDPFSKVTKGRILPDMAALDSSGRQLSGVNFGSQDYLSLVSDPRLARVAAEAAEQYGVHSSGSAALMGLTTPTRELEDRVASFLSLRDATVFPTGWGAGYGGIKTLLRSGDHVVIDVLAHASLQEAANASGAQVHRFPHCQTDAVVRRLKRIRSEHPTAGILLVTEGVFSMDSDVPDLAALHNSCREYDATLFVDVAHDLGAIGATGRGVLEEQQMVGKVDVVMGSFSKVFASNGGFVATNDLSLKYALRYGCGPLTFTTSLSPLLASIALEAFRIVDSEEGTERRSRLMNNSLHLRRRLAEESFQVLGRPSAIVPVVLGGNAISREMTREILSSGALVNLVEYPAVSKNSCRWRVQVMADHTEEQVEKFVDLAVQARRAATHRLSTVKA